MTDMLTSGPVVSTTTLNLKIFSDEKVILYAMEVFEKAYEVNSIYFSP